MPAFQFFENSVSRGAFHHKSKKLNTLVSAVKTYESRPGFRELEEVREAFRVWRFGEKNEYASRGAAVKDRFDDALRIEGSKYGLGLGTIPLLNRGTANPVYEPDKWNNNLNILRSTNCYAYACDDPNGHASNDKPQPGMVAGLPNHPGMGPRFMSEPAVRFAVLQDDQRRNNLRVGHLKPVVRMRDEIASGSNLDIENIIGHYLIALVVSPQRDYHWYRQDRSGLWSHKPGHTIATDLDASGRPIVDPRTCDLGIYSFTCFYYAPLGGVRTASLGDWYDLNWSINKP